MMSDDDGYDFVGSLDPVELFKDGSEIVKSNLNSAQCTALAASDALAEYYQDSGKNVMDSFRRGIRYYSRAKNGYATEKYVTVLGRRVEVRDQNPGVDELE